MAEPKPNPVNLCYQMGKYTFILPVHHSEIDSIRTRRLLGAHNYNFKSELLVLETDRIALYQDDLHRMYNIPDAGFRIHLNVPVSTDMDYMCPTTAELNVFIYFE